jgi:hypothetical protein
MQQPVKFQIDPAKDFEVFQGFLQDAEFDGGRNLEWAVYGKFSELKNISKGNFTKGKEKLIKHHIAQYYLDHSLQIKQNISDYRAAWESKQEEYFHLIDEIFEMRPWPKGQYVAYATIWGMYPRSLEDKTFQIPAIYNDKPYVNVIIAHEMLHFMFYDYLFKKYPELNNEDDNYLTWNISEIFNSVVQNSELWLKVFTLKTMSYPEHEEVEKNLLVKYPNVTHRNIKQLTNDILLISKELVSSSNLQ